MSTRFATWAENFRLFFSGERGQAWLRTIGKTLGDDLEEGGVLAIRETMPEYATEHAHAQQVGAERGIEAGPTQSETDARTLYRTARSLNRFRGTPLGMLTALHFADFTHPGGGAVLITQNGQAWYIAGVPYLDDLEDAESDGVPAWLVKTTNPLSNPAIPAATGRTSTPAVAPFSADWYSLTGGPMDSAGDQWTARFAILFPFGLPGPASLALPENLARIRRIIRGWKPAKTQCVGIYVAAGGGAVWGWGGAWGGGAVWGGNPTTYYSAT